MLVTVTATLPSVLASFASAVPSMPFRARSESVNPPAVAATVESGDAPGKISFEVFKPKAKAKGHVKSRDPRALAAEIAMDVGAKRGRRNIRAPIPSVVM